ncbi:pectin lyase fold/virulence factor [Echria macrotheca]|uniref:Pectin lyase fold/virulence factor n=1 Tax=Echria macrotheca TaxID=438768 RepID=A0AAJ0BDV9_9PEZI|nr:pectin lyase fold/virulence factor [Echria macrotheca]
MLLRVFLGTALLAGALSHPLSTPNIQVRQTDDDVHYYDEACNIGYCSIYGATIGGWGGNYTNVTTLEQLTTAVTGSESIVVVVQGAITGNATIQVGSSKSIIGSPGSSLSGLNLSLNGSRNIIFRNLNITAPVPITIQSGRSIWIDHCSLSSSSSSSINTLLSITAGSDYLTISNNIFSSPSHQTSPPRSNAVQIGNPTGPAVEPTEKPHITLIGNVFFGVNTGITITTGTTHILNSLFQHSATGVNAISSAAAGGAAGGEGEGEGGGVAGGVLVESTIFEDVSQPLVVTNSNGTTTTTAGGGRVSIGQNVTTTKNGGGNVTTSTLPPRLGDLSGDNLPYPYDDYVLDLEGVRREGKLAGPTLRFAPAAAAGLGRR